MKSNLLGGKFKTLKHLRNDGMTESSGLLPLGLA